MCLAQGVTISIHTDKGSLYKTNLLSQLQTLRLNENGDMCEHLTKLTEIREQLAEMNCPVTDESFVSYIRTSLSLIPTYQTLLITLSATAHKSGKKLTSSNLIWYLTPSWETIHWIIGNSLQLYIGKLVAVFISSGLQLSLGKPSAVQVSGDGQQFIMSCPGRAADQM